MIATGDDVRRVFQRGLADHALRAEAERLDDEVAARPSAVVVV